MTSRKTIQTLARAYDELASGKEGFRIAIGNFMNAFFLYYVNNRQHLIDDPIRLPENPTEDQRGWAAFCAGAAEYLAERYHLTCPSWVYNPLYSMCEPWYIVHNANQAMREDFQETTPNVWKSRNVFCGDRVFSNHHPSSREPGSYAELQRRRMEKLAAMTPAERDVYLTQMTSKPRVHIVA